MSLGCARCGDCCDPVHLDLIQAYKVDDWRRYLAERPDDPPPPGSDQAFILAHWTEIERYDGGARYSCDRFDPDTRSCTAHEDRPDVCRNFPFYDRVPEPSAFAKNSRCSFLLDVAPGERPDGARPLIPLEVIR